MTILEILSCCTKYIGFNHKMTANNVINVLIASPGDIVVERKIVKEVCLGLNESPLLNDLGVSFSSSSWEECVSPDDVIDDIVARVADEYDILVFIAHEHIFPSTAGEKLGSIERFLSAYDVWKSLKKPHVMFYFKEENLHSTDDRDDDHIVNMLELKNVMKKEKTVYFDEFSAPYEFCESIFNHLEHWATVITKKL